MYREREELKEEEKGRKEMPLLDDDGWWLINKIYYTVLMDTVITLTFSIFFVLKTRSFVGLL